VPRVPTGRAARRIYRPADAILQGSAHLQLSLSVAARASQHVTDDRHLVYDHRVVTLARLAVELSSQYVRILQILDYFLLASSDEHSDVVDVAVDIAEDLDDEECARQRV